MQAGLCPGIIKLFRDRRVVLLAQFNSYQATHVKHTSDVKSYMPKIREHYTEE
jgi:hypothetical protein